MEESLMSPGEVAVCSQIASGEAPYSQRAQALLSLAAGNTQAEAAAESGLTENQVRYWLGRFRGNRLAIFPEELATAVTEAGPYSPAADLDEIVTESAATVVVEDVVTKPKKKKKAPPKKDKKGKKAKDKNKVKKKKKKTAKKKESKKKKSSKKASKGKNKKSKKKAKKK